MEVKDMYQIILYGIAGADQQYIAQMYYCLYEEEISIYNIMYQARMLKAKCPSMCTRLTIGEVSAANIWTASVCTRLRAV